MKTEMREEILLDTHVWIWFVSGEMKAIKPQTLKKIEQAAKTGSLRISPISIWEVGMLEAKGRISIPMDCADWIDQALTGANITVLPLSPEIALESSRLPHGFNGDPADCMIVATARKHGIILATRDRMMLDYGKKNQVRILPV